MDVNLGQGKRWGRWFKDKLSSTAESAEGPAEMVLCLGAPVSSRGSEFGSQHPLWLLINIYDSILKGSGELSCVHRQTHSFINKIRSSLKGKESSHDLENLLNQERSEVWGELLWSRRLYGKSLGWLDILYGGNSWPEHIQEGRSFHRHKWGPKDIT